jgi:site-specific recombinase
MNQAFVYSMNYALGFVLIHMLHFTIATKQPAMTAATIAAAVSESQRRGDLGRLADLIVDVLRSQFAAILGNVSIAFPTAIALAYGVSYLTGKPFIDGAKAFHLLHDLNPIASLAVPHAAIAGVCLFLTGLISGYFDNRAVYGRIPERIARLPWLQALLGRDRAARAGAWVGENLGGVAGNFFFGIMLGSMGTLGLLFGLPLDIRHIAFASANLAYALVALDFALPWQEYAWGILGVALIGLTNLAVSFALALWVALRARDTAFGRTRELMGLLWRRFVSAPGRFFVPPARPAAAPE